MLLNGKPGIQLTDADKTALFSSAVFMFLVHAYRWMNSIFNHDSLLIFQADRGFQISLGRFLNPVYVWVRGKIAAPYLIALLAVFFISFSVMLIVRILALRSRAAIVMTAGLTVGFETITFLNGVYIQWLDIQLLSILFAVSAAYFLTVSRMRRRFFAAVLCGVMSLGLYQASVETMMVLICLYLLRMVLLEDGPLRSRINTGLAAAGCLLLTGVIYYLCFRIVCIIKGTQPIDTYNGLVQITRLPLASLPALIVRAWRFPFYYLCRSDIAHTKISACIYYILLALSAAGILYLGKSRKIPVKSWILTAGILLITPLASNITYVLTQGMKYGVMMFSFSLFAVAAVMILDQCRESGDTADTAGTGINVIQKSRPVMVMLCGVLIFNHTVFANQLYLRKDLEVQAGLMFMNRLVERMEETPGYTVGQTKVVILGNSDENPVSHTMQGFDMIRDIQPGTAHHMGFTYYKTYFNYFEYMLEYPIQLASEEEVISWSYNTEAQAMSVFPAEGSVRMIGDTLVIRLSENLLMEGIG